MDLNGTSAIVTGGASGLGLATSRLLAERGVRVVVADLQEDKGVPLAKEIGGLFVQTDVTNPEQVIAAVDAAVEMAPLKSLVNCAGIGWATRTIGRDGDYASAHDLDLYRRVIEINLIGTFNCVRLAATKMSLNEPDADGARGAIVNTSSVVGQVGIPGFGVYTASKHAVNGLTRSAALEVAKQGVRVNAVAFGTIQTPMIDRMVGESQTDNAQRDWLKSFHPVGRLGTSQQSMRHVIQRDPSAAKHFSAGWNYCQRQPASSNIISNKRSPFPLTS